MKLFVAIPAYDCKIHIGTANALAAEMALAAMAGVGMRVSFQPGMSLVHAARNLLCADFLESDCTHLAFVDADCGWQAGDLIKLAARGREVVAGACRRRRDPESYAIEWLSDIAPDADGLIEVAGIGMAFTVISRAALERLRDATPHRAYTSDGRKLHGFFDSPVRNGSLWGEDMAFCAAWRGCGGRIFVNPNVTLQHLEGLATYQGTLGRWLETGETG